MAKIGIIQKLNHAHDRLSEYPASVMNANLKGISFYIAEFVLFCLNLVVTAVAVVISCVDVGPFPLAVALIQMVLFSVGDLFDYCGVARNKDTEGGRARIRCYPPGYLISVLVVLLGSFTCLFVLLSFQDSVTGGSITAAINNASNAGGLAGSLPRSSIVIRVLVCVLYLFYIPILQGKIARLVIAFKGAPSGLDPQLDCLQVMSGYVDRDDSTRTQMLAQLESSVQSDSNHKRSEAFFEDLWNKVILPELMDLYEDGYSCIEAEETRKRIWFCYCCLNLHASSNYMVDPTSVLDRHKIASCYMLAIVCASVIDVAGIDAASERYFANERLAITTGCSILSSFISYRLELLSEKEEDSVMMYLLMNESERVGSKGMAFPTLVGHGDSYEQSLCRMLWFMRAENNYNVLGLSLIAYEWERGTLASSAHKRLINSYYDKRL